MNHKHLKIHMIGHGHIDPVWLWRWQEGLEETRATFHSALDRMKEDPGFKFTASSACFYKWILRADPEMFAEIQGRVKEGRWEIIGGWWIEPDCNLPEGESLVRQGLYGQKFFLKHFGKKATIGFNPDSFGHAATIPQILFGQGMESYIFMRPYPEKEMAFPDKNRGTVFFWESPDGSRVLGITIPISYGGDGDMRGKILETLDWPYLNKKQKNIICFFGVGNHGGGPTKRTIRKINELAQEKGMPEIAFSSAQEFVREYLSNCSRETLPVITTELQHHAVGCYSVNSEIKTLNRICEHALMQAERFSTLKNMLLPQDYREGPALENSWELTLFNQFHDIIAGSSIKEAYDDARDSLGQVRHTCHQIIENCLTSIAQTIDTSEEGRTIVIFNPLPWLVKQPVVVTPGIKRGLGEIEVLDNDGKPVVSQKIPSGQVGDFGYQFLSEVEGLGYRCYRAIKARPGKKKYSGMRNCSGISLENAWWVLELDENSGFIKRLYDKKNRVEILQKGAVLVSMVDHSDTWSHDVKGYRTEDGRFGEAEFYPQESGPVQTTIRARSYHSDSFVDQYFTLYREIPDIDCRLTVNWRESYRTLKLNFETRLVNTTCFAGIPYGCIERNPRGEEEPFQNWVELCGQTESSVRKIDYGLAILIPGKSGYDACENNLRITLLRSPAYAHNDVARYQKDAGHPIVDQGLQEIRYRIVPHFNDLHAAEIPRKSWETNEPLLIHQEYSHFGKLPKEACFLKVKPDNIIISVWKVSEEKTDDFIIRGYETRGRATKFEIDFPDFHKKYRGKIGAFEIKTLKFDRNFQAKEVNLIEEEVEKTYRA